MTVTQLIDALLTFPPEVQVEVSIPAYCPITMVARRPETGTVCLIPGEPEK